MRQRLWLFALVTLAAADVVLPAVFGEGSPPLALHHLEHAFLLLVGGVLGGRGALRRPRPWGDPLWLFAVVLFSTAGLLLMLPDLYARVDEVPVLHVLLHVGFVVAGFLGGYAAERYSPGNRFAWVLLVAVTGVVTATGFGAPPPHA